MQSRAVEFAKKFSVPFEVQSSFSRNPGTVAREETANMEDVVVRGVSIERKQAKVTLADVPDIPGIASRVFSAVSAANIMVDMIVQSASEKNTTDLSFTINEADLPDGESSWSRSSPVWAARRFLRRMGRQAQRGRDRDALSLWSRRTALRMSRTRRD